MSLRALGLVVLVATQAVAGGVSGVVHLCSMEAKRDTCRCKHREQQTAHLTAFRKHDCCKTSTVEAAAPLAATAELRAPCPGVSAPPTPPVRLGEAPPAAPRAPLARQPASPSQGPPIFLRVQALLR